MIRPSALCFFPDDVRGEFRRPPIGERIECHKYLQDVVEGNADPRRMARVCRSSHPEAYERPLGTNSVVFAVERFPDSNEIAVVILFAGRSTRPGAVFEARIVAPRLAELKKELQR